MFNIRHEKTPKGLKATLTHWHRGVRYRIVLGYQLTKTEEIEEVLKAVREIEEQASKPPAADSMTFQEFVPLYIKRMEARHRIAPRRNLSAIETHLLPFFGAMKLKNVRLENGDAFVVKRLKDGAANGTVSRECSVLSAILNHAVDSEYLDRNRLRRMAVPEGTKRSRVVTSEDLNKLHPICFSQLWRAVMVALNTGLREQKIVDIDQAWIVNAQDGPWLHLPKARTKHKGNPDRMPLNRLAMDALRLDVTYLGGHRVFSNWHDGEVLGAIFRRKVQKANIADLHFHDLRHSFSTALENCEVDSRTIDLLMGHRILGVGEDYRHGGPGRDKTLRDAVTKLESYWRSLPLKVPLSPGTLLSASKSS